jgi:hypothetical protein
VLDNKTLKRIFGLKRNELTRKLGKLYKEFTVLNLLD